MGLRMRQQMSDEGEDAMGRRVIEANGIPKAEYKKREQEINEKIEETRQEWFEMWQDKEWE